MLFYNARAFTFDPARPRAQALSVRDGRIEAVDPPRTSGPVFDCKGLTLVPAFADAHIHLLALAATLRSVDCTPERARSIGEIQAAIWTRARQTPPGTWIRAFGYDESKLAERRHPTRRDLDLATRDHPVRLIHRSGHACVLNSLALERAGVRIDTEEPPGGVIERDLETGEPSGLLIEMNDVVDRAAPPLPFDELAASMREVTQLLLAAGVTSVVDATHTNSGDTWRLFERMAAAGALPPRVAIMEGFAHLGELPERSADGRLTRGLVKIMVSEVGGLTPDAVALREMVAEVHVRGRAVAIHAVEEPAVRAAVEAIEAALAALPRPGHGHRIEHAGVVPEDLRGRIARAGISVVTQPSFLYHSGDRYLKTVAPSALADLYPVGRLLGAGVDVVFSSDAPVAPPAPLEAVRAAVERRSSGGQIIGPQDAVDLETALRLHVGGAVLRPGERADFVLLSGLTVEYATSWPEASPVWVEAVIVGGEMEWVRPAGLIDSEFGASL